MAQSAWPYRTGDEMSAIGRTFITGSLAALPLALTILVIGWSVSLLREYLGPASDFGQLLISLGLGFGTTEYAAYGLGLLVVVIAIYALGLIVQSSIGPWILGAVDSLIRRIPLVSSLYDLSSRFVSVVDTNNNDSLKSMSPAWCYFGGKPGAAVLALLPQKEPIIMSGVAYLAVLIPSAPVPFGGALIYVPAEWIEPAPDGIDSLLSVYVSMGVSPPSPPPGGQINQA